MVVDFEDLFRQADHKRNNGLAAEAQAMYQDIAALALEYNQQTQAASAYHMAGVSLLSKMRSGQQSIYQQVIDLLGKALVIYQQIGDQVGSGKVLRDIGKSSAEFGDAIHALEAYQKSIAILEPTEAYEELGITYDKMGLMYCRLGQPETALKYIDRAVALYRKSPLNGFYRATTFADRARALFMLGKTEEAISDAVEGLSWFEADHEKEEYIFRRAQIYGLLSRLYQKESNEKERMRCTSIYNRLLTEMDAEVATVIQEDLSKISTDEVV